MEDKKRAILKVESCPFFEIIHHSSAKAISLFIIH